MSKKIEYGERIETLELVKKITRGYNSLKERENLPKIAK